MKKGILKRVLSIVLAACISLPATALTAEAAETTAYEYEKVSVTDPVSNSWHVTDASTGDGSAAWAFDGDSNTRWHSNYTEDVTENGVVTNKLSSNLTWTQVSEIPAFSEIASSRAWVGGSFGRKINLSKITYEGRKDNNKNWMGQYALYVANVDSGKAVKDADFILAYNAVNTGYSTVTMQLSKPVEATHFRLAAFSSSGGGNFATASEIEVYEAVAADTTPKFGGAIVDTDTQWTQDRIREVKKSEKTSEELTSWINDQVTSEIALYAANKEYNNVTISASDLKDQAGNVISKDHVTATFIKSTKAYNGAYLGFGNPNRQLPADNGTNRSESSDILWSTEPVNMAANTVQPVWVKFAVPKTAKAGTYTGTLKVTAEGAEEALTFTYTIHVQDAVLPDASEFEDGFDIELWQYPYSSAEYYNVEPFSEKHLKIMESNMEIYKEIGGHAITTSIVEEAWSGQTYSKNSVHYPSMIKWTKGTDGNFTWDYTDFDAWVSFCKKMGLGDKIVLYSIAPWNNSIGYWQNNQLTYQSFDLTKTSDQEIWKKFLENLIAHLMEMGWFEESYMGIDERGFSTQAFDLIDSVKNSQGQSLKTAGAMDSFVSKWDLALRVTDLNVGDTAAAANATKFAELLEAREAKGYRTTLYSCTGHQPGNFSLSAPVESYWAVLNAGKMGTAGFQRWAYDAWVEDPLNDTTHNAFEAGDCFLIFPDEKTAENPVSRSSVRLERMAEGVRDVNKLMMIAKEVPALQSKVDAVFANIQYRLITSYTYLAASNVQILRNETAGFKEDLESLTEKYIKYKETGIIEDDQASNLVAYYSFDKVEGKTLTNEWGSDRNGTIADSATIAYGKKGNALSVNVAGEGAVITEDYTDLDGGDWTVGYWVKTTASFDKEISVLEDAGRNYSLSLKMASDRDAGFRVGENAGDVLTYAYAFSPNTWYQITWVQDKDRGLSMYVNGSLVKSNTWPVNNAIKAPLEVVGGTGFTGLIDEVKIYNTALTAEEIAENMQINVVSLLNKLDKYTLAEKYQSDVEGPHADDASMRYLGQPDMVQTETGRLISVFPVGHGHGRLIMKYSDDQGETWTTMENTPKCWEKSQETPTLYSLKVDDGKGGLKERLVLICACPNWDLQLGGWQMSYSDDNGETWTDYEDFWQQRNGTKNYTIVAMASLIQLKDENGNDIQKWMGVYHDYSYVNYKTYLTFDADGNPNWTEPEAYLSDYRAIESSHQICEVGMFRSPDGERIVALARNQSHAGPATMFYSDDEGKTWSEPVELPGSLAGERHKALYDPISGKLVITFREIDYDRNKNGVALDTSSDWTAGEWVAWVGTYEDLMNLKQGDYMIILDEDFAANFYSGDTGYTGMAVLEDGTFILHSYGHWDQAFSSGYVDPSTGGYNVKTDLCWIRQAKFKLGELENDEGLVNYTALNAKIAEVKDTAAEGYTEDSYSVFAAALKKAKEMSEGGYAQQIQIDAMLTELTEAFAGLKNTKPEETVKVTEAFKDVVAGKWYVDAVQYVFDHGLMSGYQDTFTPDSMMTRAMIVQTLYRMAGEPAVSDFTKYRSFKDLNDGDWFKDAVAWALNEGVATGDTYFKTFNPNASVTREQLAAFICRYAEKFEGADVALTEAQIGQILGTTKVSSWARGTFAWAIDTQLISGLANTDSAGNVTLDLAPQGTATRAQLATILQRFCE